MAQGKFSSPRPHRDEERQIEEAFRQVTGQAPGPQHRTPVMTEEAQIEQAIREVRQQAPVRPPVSPAPRQEDFDLLSSDVDAFFDGPAAVQPEDAYEEEADFLDKAAMFFGKAVRFCQRNQKVVLAGACGGALLLILAFIGIFFLGGAEPAAETILNNVYLADIPVGGMTKSEAISAVTQAAGSTYTSQDMVIDLSGTELRLSPKDTKARLDIKAAVNAAFDYGRTGTKAEQEQAQADSLQEAHIIGLLPYLNLDTGHIQDLLEDYAEESGSTLTQTTYGLEGKEPELATDKFDEDAPTQTLVILMGTPGIGFDVRDIYDRVLDAYSLHEFQVEVENVESVTEPDPIDLEAIYEEFYIEPVDDVVNMQTYETEYGSYGYEFDLKKAQKLLDKAEYGEEIRIPMEYIAPEIADADSFFRDILGEYKTRTTGNDNRNKNLQLACQAIHETVLDPGDTLSFATALNGVRGFKSAPEDTGREETDRGGVSQVASTLYYAALAADLDIVSRSNHSYIPSFAEQGLDATADLKIRNATAFPVRIEAKVSGGYVKVSIIGTEERDYYVVLDSSITNTLKPSVEYQEFEFDNADGYADGDIIEEGANGYVIKSYKVKYDSQSGRELGRDYVTTSEYPAVSQVVAFVKPEPTTEPTTVPTEPSTEATQPPTESTQPSTEPTVPSTEPPTQPPTTAATEPQAVTEPTAAPTEAPQEAPSGTEEAPAV